jgi:CSLREA domain-containing protein
MLLLTAKPAHAATFPVNSTGDDNDLDFPGGTFDGSSDGRCDIDSGTTGNQCTLRAAIQQANVTSGADTIAFNIPGSGVQTISPLSRLPEITKPVTIDGYTQPGSKRNDQAVGTNAVLNIELRGSSGLEDPFVEPASGLKLRGPSASNSVIRGLVINNVTGNKLTGYGIYISGGTGYKIEGNFIGTDPSGTFARGNDTGVKFFSNTQSSALGGTLPEARNLISGNNINGVQLEGGSADNKIQGNLIGTAKDGISPNYDKYGISPLGNGGRGVYLEPSAGPGNRILSNSIYRNDRNGNKLGIDLGGGTENTYGVTENDYDDPNTPKPDPDKDTGPNSLQNYPEITSAQIFRDPLLDDTTYIGGELNSTPSTRKKKRTFIIQFFSSPAGEVDPSGYGEGMTYLGQIQVTTDRQGKAPISLSTRAASVGEFITATATNKRTGDTSEFSNAKIVEEPDPI